jgi:hypothetical protein
LIFTGIGAGRTLLFSLIDAAGAGALGAVMAPSVVVLAAPADSGPSSGSGDGDG